MNDLNRSPNELHLREDPPRSTDLGADDPAIAALIAKLPPPGAEWPAAKRVHWLRCLAGVFDLVYRTEDGEVAIVQQPPKGRPR